MNFFLLPWQKQVELFWTRKGGKLNWLEYEACQRNIVQAYIKKEIDAHTAICNLDDALAGFTRRGSEFKQ